MNRLQTHQWILASGCIFALLSVIFGAFAAHSLKSSLSEYSIGAFETAARYQMYHALALLFCGLLAANTLSKPCLVWIKFSAITFISGILVFCGSLFLLAMLNIKWLGAITPVGGFAFILGWIFLLVGCFKMELTDDTSR